MGPGDLAPDFTLTDQHGVSRTLSDLLTQGPIVLFFYPAAMTTGCTKETCHFRDLAAAFAEAGAQRIGISMDDVAKQAAFSDANALDYPLLSDVDGRVAKSYGVKRALDVLRVKRTTFVIGTDRRLIDVISSEMNMNVHADRALAALRA
ncbi:MAG: peroxiredoxin [Acidimicrobiales bacterium]